MTEKEGGVKQGKRGEERRGEGKKMRHETGIQEKRSHLLQFYS